MQQALNRLKVSLVRAFHWNLVEIAATDIESLFGFFEAYGEEVEESPSQAPRSRRMAYADEVNWL